MSHSEERWIEAEAMKHSDDEDGDGLNSLFQDPDPYDVFDFEWTHKNHSIQLQLKGLKQELGQTLDSTGLTLWRASNILCDFMVKHTSEYVEDKKVLELGAGLGLCGILAHHLGASNVILTDGDTDTLENMRENVGRNCSHHRESVSCKQLVWGRQIENFVNQNDQFDLIIGSDIIYLDEILDPLFIETVPMLLKDDGHFLLAYARRNVSIDLVFQAAAQASLVWSSCDQSEGVYIFQKRKPVNNMPLS